MEGEPKGPILVVEGDRRQGLELIEQLLADGYAVELACTAEHARVLARESAPKLALLGELDPPRGTLGLLEEIRRSPRPGMPWERRLPTIVLGSGAQQLDMLRAFEAGADDFLSKPAAYLELRGFLSSTAGTAISSRGLGKMAHFGCRDTRQFRARLASKSRAKSR